MKKAGKVIYFGLVLCLVASMFGLGYAKAAPLKEVKLRLSCGLPITHFFTDGMKLFKQEVEAGTKGAVKVEIYPGGELFKHRDIPRAVPMGAVEMAIGSTAHLAGLNPIGTGGALYFLVTTADQWFKGRDKVMPILDKLYAPHNIKIIAPLYYGETAFGSKKPIRVPADIKGLKVRGPAQAQLDCIKAWEAVGTTLAAGEVYDALGKGAIDVICTGWSSHGARAHYEVAKYFSGPMKFTQWILIINLDTWNGLSKDAQETIAKAAKKFENFTKNKYEEEDKRWIDKIKQSGAEVYFFTPEELDEWVAKTKSAFDKWVSDCKKAGCGDEAVEILKALKIKGY